MATASVSTTPGPECSICCENLKTPKFITCGHTFCLDCIDRYIGDKTETFLCPICQQNVNIPDGGAKMFTTNFILQTFPHTPTPTSPITHVPGIPTSPTSNQTSEITDQPVKTIKHHCPNHSKKEVEYYCQTCSLGLCSKCIYRDHNDHKTLDLECDSTREIVVEELSKNKIKNLEKILAGLFETSEKLKSFCDEACTKISEKTAKIIYELKEKCEKGQKEIRDNFDKNESQLTETRQEVTTQITNIKTELDTSCPTTTEEPSLTLIYSLTKLQDLQKLCENMKTDIPPVTYVEWRVGNVKVCDILGSTETKPLYQSNEGYVFKFNYKDIEKDNVSYYSKDKYTSQGMVWGCKVWKYNRYLFIYIELLPEDNPQVDHCKIKYTLTMLNKDKDKNVISKIRSMRFFTDEVNWKEDIQMLWNKLTDPSEGFIDNEGQFLVRFDILQVLDITYYK